MNIALAQAESITSSPGLGRIVLTIVLVTVAIIASMTIYFIWQSRPSAAQARMRARREALIAKQVLDDNFASSLQKLESAKQTLETATRRMNNHEAGLIWAAYAAAEDAFMEANQLYEQNKVSSFEITTLGMTLNRYHKVTQELTTINCLYKLADELLVKAQTQPA